MKYKQKIMFDRSAFPTLKQHLKKNMKPVRKD